LVMFGMMFGDVGHGISLIIGGVVLIRKWPRLAGIGQLAVYCGGSSAVFGILYGSLFGLEDVIPALWVRPLQGINSLFVFAVGFGVLMMSLGLVLNIVNSIRMHTFWEGFFDSAGPFVALVYWLAVGNGVRYLVSSKRLSHPEWVAGLFVFLFAVFLLRGPLLKMSGKRRQAFPEGVGTYIMETFMEILEMLMGYLSNTVSFIRVAAFGLAHAGLFVAVFTLANLVKDAPLGPLWTWIVIILGNITIIVFEGLVVTIQVLRLEYYEFFGKFFRSGGSKYRPAGFSEAFLDGTN